MAAVATPVMGVAVTGIISLRLRHGVHNGPPISTERVDCFCYRCFAAAGCVSKPSARSEAKSCLPKA
jgi:hypothetical protein